MMLETVAPDLELSLEIDAFAPRLARHRLEEVENLGPDLRDAVSLLTSDLVTRAVRACPSEKGPEVHLSVWMPTDVVRVELRTPSMLLASMQEVDCSPFERVLLDQVADRWSIDQVNQTGCMWFEIDRVSGTEGHQDERNLANSKGQRL